MLNQEDYLVTKRRSPWLTTSTDDMEANGLFFPVARQILLVLLTLPEITKEVFNTKVKDGRFGKLVINVLRTEDNLSDIFSRINFILQLYFQSSINLRVRSRKKKYHTECDKESSSIFIVFQHVISENLNGVA